MSSLNNSTSSEINDVIYSFTLGTHTIPYDSELIPYDPRFNRNFEQLVTERYDESHGFYDDVFEVIKNKLFTLSEKELILSDSKKLEFEHKYSFSQFSNVTEIVKNSISNFYKEKIQIESDFEENKKKYEQFSKNILQTISDIDTVTHVITEKDEHFKEVLQERINWYYSELKLDELKLECDNLELEFLYLRKYMYQLSEITSPTVCQICQERQITHFIDPCGHTLCEICKNRSERMINCHFCRTKKKSFKKLYL